MHLAPLHKYYIARNRLVSDAKETVRPQTDNSQRLFPRWNQKLYPNRCITLWYNALHIYSHSPYAIRSLARAWHWMATRSENVHCAVIHKWRMLKWNGCIMPNFVERSLSIITWTRLARFALLFETFYNPGLDASGSFTNSTLILNMYCCISSGTALAITQISHSWLRHIHTNTKVCRIRIREKQHRNGDQKLSPVSIGQNMECIPSYSL